MDMSRNSSSSIYSVGYAFCFISEAAANVSIETDLSLYYTCEKWGAITLRSSCMCRSNLVSSISQLTWQAQMHFSCYVQVAAARAIINDNGRTEDTHACSARYSKMGYAAENWGHAAVVGLGVSTAALAHQLRSIRLNSVSAALWTSHSLYNRHALQSALTPFCTTARDCATGDFLCTCAPCKSEKSRGK